MALPMAVKADPAVGRRSVNVERTYEQTKSAGFSGETLLSHSCQESVATR
jgi:hypothetical protein